MIKRLNLTVLVTVLGVFVLTNCQEKQTQETVVDESKIPVSTTSEEAYAKFKEGLAWFDEGNGQKARPLFDEALKLDPNFVSAQLYRTFSANSAKDFGEQRERFLALRSNANEAEAILMDFVEANKADDDMGELEAMKRLAEKYPKSARAQVFVAGAYEGIDEFEKGRAHYEKALELDNEHLPALSALGVSYMFFKPMDFQKAEKYMQKAVELAPNSARKHIDLGDAYRAQNNLENALNSYVKASELDSEDPITFSKAGHANSFLGNYEAARKNYQDARAVSEFGTGSFNFEGFTYLYEDGNYKKALEFFKEVDASVDDMDIPESNKTGTKANCHFNSAMIALHYDDVESLKSIVDSWKPLAQRIAEDVDSEAARLNQKANMQYWDAVAMALEGDFDGAVAKSEDIKSTLESIKDPHKLRGYHRLHAIINYSKENYEKALEHMSNLDETNVYDKFWMAKAHMASGNTEKAMEMFTELSTYNFNSVGYALIRNEVIAILDSQNV